MEWFVSSLLLFVTLDLHFRGAEFTTPTIDALARSGIILDQYYVQVGFF
jgi:hypothetical protein